MNAATMIRLVWKEYRAVRGFWVAMALLVVLAQSAVLTLAKPGDWRINVIYSLALAAPAFFALGCAGAAFAVEREEGTFEFLRATSVSSRQILASKLGMAFLATLALLALLWPMAMLITRAQPTAATLSGMLGLWLVAAIEGIAWGTFFSLRSARPLVAVTLALVVSSTLTHLTAWTVAGHNTSAFDLTRYQQAVPARLAIALVVLAIDVVLGLRWLESGEDRPGRLLGKLFRLRDRSLSFDDAVALSALRRRVDRGSMFSHLLWQHWRQSARLMGLVVLAQLSTSVVFLISDANSSPAILVLAPVFAAVGGSLVFRPDQERSHFRFFVEHNVPPRWVWFTRQLSWSALLIASGFLQLMTILFALWFLRRWNFNVTFGELIRLPNGAGMALALLPVGWLAAYAAGQWTSMLVKSGLMSGFLGLLLAAVLIGWGALTATVGISPIFTVLPLCLALLYATWLRSPDWVREDVSWPARGRAAAVVLVPTLAIMSAVAAYRVYEVPVVAPGFDPQQYLAEITPASRATAEMYREANELFLHENFSEADLAVMMGGSDREWQEHERNTRPARQRHMLEENRDCLALLLAASERPDCTLIDPRRPKDELHLPFASSLLRLVRTSGDELASQGQLDEAFERYLSALKIVSHWNDHMPSLVNGDRPAYQAIDIFDALMVWTDHKEQTPERLRAAVDTLGQYGNRILRLDDAIESNYLLARYAVLNEHGARKVLLEHNAPSAYILPLLSLMPWEKARELRVQDLIARNALSRLHQLRENLEKGAATVDLLPLHNNSHLSPLQSGLGNSYWAIQAAEDLMFYEERYRATLLRMALAGYRLEHGKLPDSLTELVGTYFKNLEALPRDPYSGRHYVYFPQGVPATNSPLEAADLAEARAYRSDVNYLMPGFWSTGPMIRAERWRGSGMIADTSVTPNKDEWIVYYSSRYPYELNAQLRTYQALSRGHWYAIGKPSPSND